MSFEITFRNLSPREVSMLAPGSYPSKWVFVASKMLLYFLKSFIVIKSVFTFLRDKSSYNPFAPYDAFP
jgi:hypothetical protein